MMPDPHCGTPRPDFLIEVDGFTKAYDGRSAVCGCSFAVRPGEILGVIGPNGAGKTTTMRTLAALIPPTKGTLCVCGHDVVSDPLDVKRQLAYIPDDPQLFSHLTVNEHLAFTAAAYNVRDVDTTATALLEAFELATRRDTPAKDLSRGMRQKLAICCGYLYDPAVLLFDEPLTGLDPYGIRKLKESILERASQGAAVLVSSHLLAMVEDICSHILLLHEGSQRFFGPISEFCNSFIGQDTTTTLESIFFKATGASVPEAVALPAATL